MFSFLTNDKNDLYLSSTNTGGKAVAGSVLVTGNAEKALQQIIVNRVRLQQGEYDYDLSRGINYMGLLFTDTPLVRLWEKQVFDIINSIPQIQGIRYWNYGLKGNNFLFRLSVDSDYGVIEIKG